MLTPDKIFTTVKRVPVVHMRRYNQHKMKVPWKCYRDRQRYLHFKP